MCHYEKLELMKINDFVFWKYMFVINLLQKSIYETAMDFFALTIPYLQ